MENKIIESVFRNTTGDLVLLDYAGPDDAVEIDRSIRDSINSIRLSILAMGIGLAKIKTNRLYRKLGCKSMISYIRMLSADTKMDQNSIYKWLNIGTAYLKYQSDLEQIGFKDSDGPTKLPYLKRALEINKKEELLLFKKSNPDCRKSNGRRGIHSAGTPA